MTAIKLSKLELDSVREILSEHLSVHGQSVWVFGSRANGNPRTDSDLDPLFDPPLSLAVRSKLSQAFEESSLSFEVDLANRDDVAPEYKDGVEAGKLPLL
jgi:predicted nucleotidyltransferase